MKTNFAISILLCLLFSVETAISASDSDSPSMPFEDEGACPFECCTYKDWTVNADTSFYKDRTTSSEIVFKASKDEPVEGLTGVVVTMTPGKIRVKKAMTLGEDTKIEAKPNDVLFVLHYEGEGYSKFWFQGKIYSDMLPFSDESKDSLEMLNEPKTVWWVKVKNSKGQIGWSNETDHFDHMDACE